MTAIELIGPSGPNPISKFKSNFPSPDNLAMEFLLLPSTSSKSPTIIILPKESNTSKSITSPFTPKPGWNVSSTDPS